LYPYIIGRNAARCKKNKGPEKSTEEFCALCRNLLAALENGRRNYNICAGKGQAETQGALKEGGFYGKITQNYDRGGGPYE
jgi:hypothetical protein